MYFADNMVHQQPSPYVLDIYWHADAKAQLLKVNHIFEHLAS